MSLFCQYAPYRLAEGTWEERREEIGRNIIRTLGEYAPNLPGAVEGMEVLGPPDIEARIGITGGNIFHGEILPDAMFSGRPVPATAATARRLRTSTSAGPAPGPEGRSSAPRAATARWRYSIRPGTHTRRSDRQRERKRAMQTGTRSIKNFVNGEHVDPAEGRFYDVTNPATGEVFAQAPASGKEDVDRAYKAAEKAFEGWRDATPGHTAARPVQDRRRLGGAGRGDRAGRVREHGQAHRSYDGRRDTDGG
jgi:hypothetical protein